jgi:aminoglycoside/choline kinase family phosphotransferase
MAAVQEKLKKLYKERFKEPASDCAPMKGDGSGRSLFRLKGASGRTVVGAASSDRQENAAFLSFSRHFKKSGLPVPEIYAEKLDDGIYLEEDLGDTTLFQFLTAHRGKSGPDHPTVEAYKKAVRLLPKLQIEAGKDLDYSVCYPRGSFDRTSMLWDLNYFKYYFLRLSGMPFHEQALEDDFQKFADYLLAAPRDYFLYRDFQSRNIMLKDGEPYFIDYQGGRKGALQYDIASLLYDAKADLPFKLRDELLALYIAEAGKYAKVDKAKFLEFFPGYVYIRIMQAMGAYGLRGFYERKAHFLQSIPYAIRNLEHLLRTTDLPIKTPELMAVFKRLVGSSKLRQVADVVLPLTVRVESFSFKNGVPQDEKGHGGGFVFDCRGLPNPGRYDKYAKLSGLDQPVIAYLEKEADVFRFLSHAYELVDLTVESYQKRNFTDLMVSFGCTGGQHRSVYCSEALAKHLRERYKATVELKHREREHWKK